MISSSVARQPTHVGYADETQYNVGRYRGLALVTLQVEDASRLQPLLQHLLQESAVAEFKWAALRTARMRFAAIKLLSWTIEHALQGLLRIDVLTWESGEGHQQATAGQTAISTLQQMYARLLNSVLGRHWPEGCIWRLCPDEQNAIQWEKLREQIAEHAFALEQILPCESHREPLIQLADLFAGLAVYSRSAYDRYEEWQQIAGLPAESLSPEELPGTVTGSDRERYAVLADFSAQCVKQQMPVSLQASRGLSTADPTTPIHFWWHESSAI